MIEEIQNLFNSYIDWLRDKTQLREVGDAVEITTPYLDRHNDYLQIIVKKNGNEYVLSDDGFIIEDLHQSGCDLTSKKRSDILDMTLNGFGVTKEGTILTVKARSFDFSIKKHNLIQAMLAVNDLFFMATPVVASLFIEDVTQWLDLSDIRYTPKVKFTGKSGYDHLFDFVIPKSKSAPERIIKAINNPNRASAESYVFSWIDTKDVRASDTTAYAVLNDSEITPSNEVLSALQSYEINPIYWSKKQESLELLRT